MMNEMMMDKRILLHKPNKKVKSEKKMDHLISQTKHTHNDLATMAGTTFGAGK
jgi:hypothetical protein